MRHEMPPTGGQVFGDVVLDDTCLFAHRRGEQIRFTRSERALLLALTRNPHRLMQRSQLLDAIAPTQADASDRNVDFLVNRLRTKLGDSARSPRFIATQYGEGYVWIAATQPAAAPRPDPAPASRLLAIVPAVNPHDARLAETADAVVGQLRDRIAGELDAGQAVIVAERNESTVLGARYVLMVSFQRNAARLDCTATLREGPSRRIIRAFRLELGAAGLTALDSEVQRAATGINAALQRNLGEASQGLGTPIDQPHEIRLRAASTLLSASNPQWLEKGSPAPGCANTESGQRRPRAAMGPAPLRPPRPHQSLHRHRQRRARRDRERDRGDRARLPAPHRDQPAPDAGRRQAALFRRSRPS